MKSVGEDLTRKLKLAAKVRVVRTVARSVPLLPTTPALADESKAVGTSTQIGMKFPIIVIAGSTGGPAAASRVVSGLPKDLPAAVFVVLHMPAAFTKQFTLQLAEISPVPVKEAEANEVAQPGMIYVCPGSHHLRLSVSGRIALDSGPRIDGYRPCANAALESVAAYARALATAVVLTGMGDDAAKGAKAVDDAGGYVIAQNESSSTIFGMPAEAIKTGAVDEVLPLDDISPAIEKHVAKLCRLTPVGSR
jgi:two-component system, chemotaxis family, protein-glutamate methylesterase/glutaminase